MTFRDFPQSACTTSIKTLTPELYKDAEVTSLLTADRLLMERDDVCGKGQGGGPPERGRNLFSTSDEENHQDTGMYFKILVV